MKNKKLYITYKNIENKQTSRCRKELCNKLGKKWGANPKIYAAIQLRPKITLSAK